jgi:hypothetical protein
MRMSDPEVFYYTGKASAINNNAIPATKDLMFTRRACRRT